MIFNVGIYENEEANKFLRKLWAEFRREFGKCAWNFIPHKIGQANIIFFGMMDIGIPEVLLEVYTSYIKKGTIKAIGFNFVGQSPSNDKIEEIERRIQAIVNISKDDFTQTYKFLFKVGIGSLLSPLGYYRGEAFSIGQSHKTRFNLTLSTTGYDDTDAQTNCKNKILQYLDLLSIETNSSFWVDDIVNEADQDGDNEEIIVHDLDWIDGYPIVKQKLRLSKAGKKFLDLINEDKLSESQELLLRACNHFHTARKYDSQVYDRLKHRSIEEVEPGLYQISLEERDERLSMAAKMGSSHMEIASVLYISALEVASSIGIEEPKNCPECGQKVYGIGRRVVDMVEKCLSISLGKSFKEYYRKRSKYLHAGELLSNYSYIGTSIPQLDPSDPTGCKVHSGIPLLNLREYTSFCLRKVLQSLVADCVV